MPTIIIIQTSNILTMRFLFGLLCLILFAFCCETVSAQYHFDSWTTDNGLPQNGVRGITQTPAGYLWFTTFDGLVRFDGVKFTVFNKGNSKGIISNRFWFIEAFEDRSIWAATEGGDLTIYRDGEFTSYPADQVPENQIIGFEKDENGEVLINTNPNFYYLRNGEFVFAKKSENDGTQKHIHLGQTGTRWEVYPTETRQIKNGQTNTYKLNVRFLDFNLSNVYEDKKGGLWIADLDKSFYLYNSEISEYTEKDGFPSNLIGHRFWEESDGSVWFATGDFNRPGVGLVRFKDGKFSRFGMEQGLSNDRIFDVFKDREGTIWLATDRGLNRLRQQVLTPLSIKDGLIHNEVYPILKARDGSIYIGTNGGLSRYKNGKFTNTVSSFGKSYGISPVQSLAEDAKGLLWIGAINGLFVLKDGKLENWTKKFELPDTIYAIYTHQDGTVWFGTEHSGVLQYKDGKIVPIYSTAEGLAGNDVKFIHEAKDGSFWFGTFGGLSYFKDGKFTNYTTKDGLASNYVRSIKEEADGTFWIGTYDSGLSRFKDGKFSNFNTTNGLFSNGVFAIAEDKNGNFWMSSNQGIYRVNKQQLNDFADGKIANYESFGYGKQDGMLNTECNGGRQPSAIADKDGRIWFPTLEGVAIVNPDNLTTNQVAPQVQIESVSVDRESVDLNKTIRLEPSQTTLDITYTALSFIKSDQIHFKYKLEGLDVDWIDAGTRRTVNYSYLPSGEYTFRVIAANTDGVLNTEGKSIKINVIAPFYKTLWFWFAVFLILAVIAYLIYRNRINQLQRINAAQEAFSRQLIESQESERKRIAQELHDGLGQNLLIIKNRAILGLTVKGKDEQFNEIQDSVTDALSEVRSIAYNLRPLHIERLGLTSTIEEMIEDVEKSSGIEINCDVEKIDELFSKENEINFYRIVQECLNNIVKHSNATKASVTVFRENSKIILTVRDDGKGFEADKIKQGLGLNGIAERVKILGGIYSIESEIGKGTTVLAEISS
jgi:signal transduction histidine kinase/ligand-binding sensor domain-containing protein